MWLAENDDPSGNATYRLRRDFALLRSSTGTVVSRLLSKSIAFEFAWLSSGSLKTVSNTKDSLSKQWYCLIGNNSKTMANDCVRQFILNLIPMTLWFGMTAVNQVLNFAAIREKIFAWMNEIREICYELSSFITANWLFASLRVKWAN